MDDDPSPPSVPQPSRRREAARPARDRGFFRTIFAEAAPLDLRILGRTLLHAALVGVAAGLVAAAFFGALEVVEHVVLGGIAGYARLRAAGETLLGEGVDNPHFRPWLLVFIPALGALVGGVLTTKLAPEARGGGGDAMIEAFHQRGGVVRKRVPLVKAAASILTLGFGGSGGREGPTMQIGAALGSIVGAWLRVTPRERRILMIAGVAAGMSAIFRTPLGAALLATEVLYRDDFESDALIPALLASVVSYSIFISFYGESTLFAHATRFPFVPWHLVFYGLLAVLISILATLFLAALDAVRKLANRLPGPAWLRPAAGGLALGCFVTPILWIVGNRLDTPGQGFGMLGGGYGAAQVAMIGASWLPAGWGGVQVLLLLCFAKLLASSLTIGSGGSAGDFAPSLVLGGLFGGAFGRAVAMLTHDPRIDPAAFALVGMGTFYGGAAHVPIGSLVMVCELAGSYDLLVPLMLAEGIAFVLLRKRFLYHAQLPTQRDSPAHARNALDVLSAIRTRDVMTLPAEYVTFELATPARTILRQVCDAAAQDVFPVRGSDGKVAGEITSDSLRILGSELEIVDYTVAADLMQPANTLSPDDHLRRASEILLETGAHEIVVVDSEGRLAGFIRESQIQRAYLNDSP